MKKGRHSRSGYHHGNLRQALLDAARKLIDEKGPEGFTLAEAARIAGVSPAAPYRHFKDRLDILGALAVSGFEDFAARLDQAWEHGRPDSLTAFIRLGHAYLAFARDDPATYRAMFAANVPLDDTPGLRTASGRSFDVLRTASAALIENVPQGSRPPVDLVSMHIWALSHGTAMLFAEGSLGRGRVPVDADDLLESGVFIYLRGLGVLPTEQS